MKIKEGKVTIDIPSSKTIYDADVFYNPKMEFDRNISVSVVSKIQELIGKKIDGCDLLAASGARGIRYIKESKIKMHLNDHNPKAISLIKKNLKLNKAKAIVTKSDANLLLRDNIFGFIDIDPFGSPMPFIESSVTALRRKGFISFTATDTAPLSGTYPKTCERRYGIRSIFTDYYHELGLRILITSVMRKFFQEDKVFIPVISYAREHYFRCFGRVESGASKADMMIENFSPVSHCIKCGWRDIVLEKKCPSCKSDIKSISNIYIGEINNSKFCENVVKDLEKRGFDAESEFVDGLSKELQVPFYYNTHVLSKKLKTDVPKLEMITEKLKGNGFKVSRTHFSPIAIKTDAGFNEVVKTLNQKS